MILHIMCILYLVIMTKKCNNGYLFPPRKGVVNVMFNILFLDLLQTQASPNWQWAALVHLSLKDILLVEGNFLLVQDEHPCML